MPNHHHVIVVRGIRRQDKARSKDYVYLVPPSE